jgi:hypothetical protein
MSAGRHDTTRADLQEEFDEHALVEGYFERDEDEPDDDYFERAAERVDLDKQSSDQDLRDAGRGHLVRP